MKTLLPILALLLAGCQTPEPPPSTEWFPEVGERVVTNWCEMCRDNIAPRPYSVVITATRKSDGLVWAKEFPDAGLSVSWVASWEVPNSIK